MRLPVLNWKALWRRLRRPASASRSGAPQAANAIIPPESTPEQLQRLCAWCTQGRLAAAEVELFAWQRHDDCPTAARTLLAAMFARRGALEDALGVLRRAQSAHHEPDSQLAQLQIAVLTATGLNAAADQALLRLHHEHGDDAAIASWIQTMAAGRDISVPDSSDRQIAHLAAELSNDLQVIPSLVAAQKYQPGLMDLRLLRHALIHLVREVHDDHPQMLLVCQALADLAMLDHDADDARRWAYRGLRINPYAAPLALVLSQVDDDQAIGPAASLVLQVAIDKHPEYADLRIAQIRHAMRHGRTDEARLHLDTWLQHQPRHPLAQQIQKELAA